jgi:PelA/Pel-15E family pectate lyase
MEIDMNIKPITLALVCAAFVFSAQTNAAPTKIELLTDQPDEWFASDEGKKTLDVVLSYQNANGGWWKAYKLDAPRPVSAGDSKDGVPGDNEQVWHRTSTIDNGATHSEIRILSRAYRVTKDERYADAARKGLKFFFDSQYANGGWPQRFPLENNYGRHITYNDDAMLGVMRVLRDAADANPDFAWLNDEERARAKASLAKGIECVLATQIVVDGKPTVWCQQHDEVTLAPASARSYELPSFCSTESAGLALFLMEMKNPDDRIKAAVHGAAAWFENHKIEGKRVERLEGPQYELGKQRNLVDDPNAKPIWARFYDLETGKPYFCDRDGVKLDSFEKLGHERRVNYAWFNDRGNQVLERYAEWCRQP